MVVQESGGEGRVAECAQRRVESVPGDPAPARRAHAQFLAACGAASLGPMDVAFVTACVTGCFRKVRKAQKPLAIRFTALNEIGV